MRSRRDSSRPRRMVARTARSPARPARKLPAARAAHGSCGDCREYASDDGGSAACLRRAPEPARTRSGSPTDRSMIARNPSPHSPRDVLQAASAASSHAYSRSSSMIQLARCTAGLKKKTACTNPLEHDHPEIAAADVGQLVKQDPRQLLGRQALVQVGGNDHRRPEAGRRPRASRAADRPPTEPRCAAQRRAAMRRGRSADDPAAAAPPGASGAGSASSPRQTAPAEDRHNSSRRASTLQGSKARPSPLRDGRGGHRHAGTLGETT